MKRKNATRTALFHSILSLMLCVSMLVSTTFAWFTDEVVSGRNTIAAGNLDVELLNDGVPVNNGTILFDDVDPNLWEPGAVAYENLQVANVGTLALKYNLDLTVLNETVVDGHKLSDVIKVGVVENGITSTDRTEVVAAVKTWTPLSTFSLNMEGVALEKGESSPEYGIVLYWQPNSNEIDNRYNMNNENRGKALKLDIGVNLFATQQVEESDSFGPDYDKNAPALIRFNNVDYDTFAEALAAARAVNGGTIEISGYVEFTPVAQHDGSHHGDEDFNGITVKGIDNTATLAIVGGGVPDIVNGTFEDLVFVDEGTYNTTAAEFMYQNFANTTFNGVTFVDGVRIGSSAAGTANTQTNFNGCVFNASTNQEYALFIDNGGVKIDGCTFNATSAAYGVIKVYDSRYALQPSNVVITNTTFNNETQKQSINSAYHEDIDITIDGVPYYNVENTDELAAALNNADAKKIINLDTSMKMAGSTTSSEVAITAAPGAVLDLTWGAYLENAKLTFDGVTIKGCTGYVTTNGTTYGSDYAALYSSNVAYNDCTFDGPFRIGRDGARFNNCTFTNLGNDYVWTYGNVASFDGCTFNSDGKAILVYSDGNGTVPAVSVTNCVFTATKEAFAGAVPGMPCAAIEIDNFGCGVNLTTSGNTIGENFSAEWRIKTYDTGKEAVFVNGTEYNGQTVGGNAFVVVGTTDELSAALTAGKTNIYLKDGTYSVPAAAKGKSLTVTGSRNAIIKVNDAGSYEHTDGGFDGSTVTFNGVTIKTREVTHYAGFVRMSGTYNNCAIVGNYGLFGDSAFNGCEFNANVGEHCVWTYGANNVAFTDCSFTYGDRGINCYRESGDKQIVEFINCSFATTNTESKGAVEINSFYFTTGIEVNMEGCTAPAYGTMVGISGWDSANGAKTTVTVDGAAFAAPQWTK